MEKDYVARKILLWTVALEKEVKEEEQNKNQIIIVRIIIIMPSLLKYGNFLPTPMGRPVSVLLCLQNIDELIFETETTNEMAVY
jgi:hypothetical protein